MSGRVSDILERAADLIEPEGRWIQGVFARNAKGEFTGLSEFRGPAVCWCISGATCKESPEDDGAEADVYLQRFLGAHPSEWNDAPERTQSEVVAKLREAAAKARSEGK